MAKVTSSTSTSTNATPTNSNLNPNPTNNGDSNGNGSSWQQRNNETFKAYKAFATYRDMGSSRSIQIVADKLGYKTAHLCWKWSAEHDWVARCKAFDSYIQEIEQAKYKENVENALTVRYASIMERINALNSLTESLELEIYEDPGTRKKLKRSNLYLMGVKGETFNSPLLSEYRACLADLAAETGGRIRKQEISTPTAGIKVLVGVDLDKI